MTSAGPAPRILVSAGEPSGDVHGARVVRALRERWPDAAIDAVGGPAMRAAGATIRFPMERLSALGIVEVLGKAPAHVRLLRELRRDFAAGRYDLLLPIDYPGFHLRLAEAARARGLKVLYYIAPQLWAWRPERAKRLARAVDRMAVILPFEEAFFRGMGIDAVFVGHPLVDRGPWPGRAEARRALGIGEGERVLGIFPGSRREEVHRLWGPFRDAARRMLDEGCCDRAVVAGTPAGSYPDAGPIEVRRGDPVPVFAAADAVLAKSGTTTLEAALADAPMVVAYQVHPLTHWVARRLATVRWISLVNLVAEREVVPELLQGDVTAERLAAELRPLLDPADPRTIAQREGLRQVRERLGTAGAASRVAAFAAELMGR